ncbi:hypothetical protein EYC98_04900 [Halieaceae bacterium IMCC14734]|uniref:PilY1 beta-propeller domain-containing protein n=1 Tax=Candidatus Litorirhabdus singularis TaxID=2518993 RepID=A0ABT3TFL7_9GAMM|nr:PilC/PilY family type IV pilus protein [Candidatus Litorirhabdus singularis]MCX2980204.1 hypothetical protein [Candidatus Litorirhabdus singularis]
MAENTDLDNSIIRPFLTAAAPARSGLNRANALLMALALAGAGTVSAAPSFDPIRQPLGSVAPLTLTDTDLSKGNVKAYRTWFENGAWQGDLIEYSVSNLGALTTTVDVSGLSPTNANPQTNWSAHWRFENTSSNYWDVSRKIITYDGSAQVGFRWANLSNDQKAALDDEARNREIDGETAVTSTILNYVRGDRRNEHPLGEAYRTRYSLLGDIIHSQPVYVAKPNAALTADGYAAWAISKASRPPRVYVGANDGMLHVFDATSGTATSGKEVYAYIPSILIGELDRLAGRPYEHHYFVDGQLSVADVYIDKTGGSSEAWRSVLVGGLGSGGKGWYALDITNPNLQEEDAISVRARDDKVMWELDANNATYGDDIGYSFGKATISKLNDGKYYAIFGNGYNSVNARAKLILVRLSDGAVIRINTGIRGNGNPQNGLSSPAAIDLDRNGTVDVVFAGDLNGNMWKFDLSKTNPALWIVAYNGTPLHTGDVTQPITLAPDVTLHPSTGLIVMFGTGQLFSDADLDTTATQALFGIWDTGSTPVAANSQSLLAQPLRSESLEYTSGTITEVVSTFTPEPGPINWSNQHGWKVELPAGYRVLQPPQLRAGRLKVTITNPGTRENWLLEAAYLDGGDPGKPIFDLNKTTTLTVDDLIDGNGDVVLDDTDDIPVMWQQASGVMSEATIARIGQGVDTQLFNYIVPPVAGGNQPCTEDCTAGFVGGHVDVDTDYYNAKAGKAKKGKPADTGGVGGKTYKHTHEYDKKTEQVYVDYLAINTGGANGHAELDDAAFIPQDTRFVIIIANGELSPGSVMTLGTEQYNVVEYQVMIHKALYDWDGSSDITDGNGNSLIFTAGGLSTSSDGSTVRHSFNDMAIVAGGLHPTNTGCVNGSDAVTQGRYRNGSLVTQAVSLSTLTGGSNPLDNLIIQTPDDYTETILLTDGTQVAMQEDLDESGSIEPIEIFGGLRGIPSGQGTPDVLWESTIFWHYPGGACYGDTDWVADVLAARDELTIDEEEFQELLDDLGITDVDQEISRCDLTGLCSNQFYQDLQALAAIEALLRYGDGIDTGGGLDSTDGVPNIVGGSAENLGITVGPNYFPGRRTWVDIIAD